MGQQKYRNVESPTIIFCRGSFQAAHEVQIPITDRGFLFGDGVFETLRTYGRVPFHIRDHIGRLRRSASSIMIPLDTSDSAIEKIVGEGIARMPAGEVGVRLQLTRGSSDFSYNLPLSPQPQLYYFFTSLTLPQHHTLAGVDVFTFVEEKPMRFAGVKLMNSVASILSRHEAQARGAYEVLRLNREDRVVEGFISNVFVVKKGHMYTPPTTEGLLAGVTRSVVMSVARNWDIAVFETPLPRGELLSADEVFLSHTSAGVVPVIGVDGTPIAGGKVGDLTRRLVQWFAALPEKPTDRESAS